MRIGQYCSTSRITLASNWRARLLMKPAGSFANRIRQFSPDDQFLITMGNSGVKMWDATSFQPIAMPLKTGSGGFVAMSSRDPRVVAARKGPCAVEVRDVDTGTLIRKVKHSIDVSRVEIDPLGNQLATKTADGRIRLWDLTAARGRILLGRSN